jgi:hypothetical protein
VGRTLQAAHGLDQHSATGPIIETAGEDASAQIGERPHENRHIADADLDGKLEVFATDHYGYLHAFRHDGSKAGSFYTSIGDMQATLAGDHRATDGRTGALFLNKLDQILQKPEEL